MKNLDVHLISDASGDSLISVFRAALSRFKDIRTKEYVWSLIESKVQIDNIFNIVKNAQYSFVMYTISSDEIREYLKNECQKLKVPCIPILSRVIRELSSYLSIKPTSSLKEYSAFSDDYFARIDAMNFVIAHDDGQNLWDVEEADIIIVGVSRTSKSPTSLYLSYRGYKVANIPLVCGIPIPDKIATLENKFIVALTINPEQLIEIRKNRLIAINNELNTQNYTDAENVIADVIAAKKIFLAHKWPIIDVTHRSIEEIATTIVRHYNNFKKENGI